MIKTILAFVLLFIISQNSFAQSRHPQLLSDSVMEGKIYQVKAVVIKKFRDQGRMIIKHERIEGFMPAMKMAFPVADTLIFDSCAVGSKGLFTLQIENGFPVITAAHFTKLPKYACPMHPHELSNKRGSCPICGMPMEKSEP